MQVNYYTGNYSLSIGQPYVILSFKEDESHFYSEAYIIFEGYDGRDFKKRSRVKYPKFDDRTLENFVQTEVEVIKDMIFCKILFVYYKPQLEMKNYNVQINLREVNESILMLLRDKFLSALKVIQEDSQYDILKNKIQLYRSIQFERSDNDLE